MHEVYPESGREAAQQVRALARLGLLSSSLAAEERGGPRRLVRAVYELVWPIVFRKITKMVELNRGHIGCARSVTMLEEDCLDRFHDDVAAVLDLVRRRATCRIDDLEGWVAGAARSATIDGHRRRRGELGALQRPRLPEWLRDLLNHDAWRVSLALRVLEWVGVRDTPSSGVWPLSRWCEQRARITGDWDGSTPDVVLAEVDHVLAMMRTEERWYSDYVERPIGRKRAPNARGADSCPLPLSTSYDIEDSRLHAKAYATMQEINARTRSGQNPRDAALDTLRKHFCAESASAMITRAPHDAAEAQDWLTTRLSNADTAWKLALDVTAVVSLDCSHRGLQRHARSR